MSPAAASHAFRAFLAFRAFRAFRAIRAFCALVAFLCAFFTCTVAGLAHICEESANYHMLFNCFLQEIINRSSGAGMLLLDFSCGAVLDSLVVQEQRFFIFPFVVQLCSFWPPAAC